MTLPKRYDGRPLLILVESYALKTLGSLTPEKEAALQRMAVKIWSSEKAANWDAILKSQLDWPDSIDSTIQRNWTNYQISARAQGEVPDQNEFAMMFADAVWEASQSP